MYAVVAIDGSYGMSMEWIMAQLDRKEMRLEILVMKQNAGREGA